jgi:hypothetical protein
MNEPGFDDRYVSYREHSQLKERFIALESALSNVPGKLETIHTDLAALALKLATGPAQSNLPVPYTPPQEIIRQVTRGIGFGPTATIIITSTAALTMLLKQLGM